MSAEMQYEVPAFLYERTLFYEFIRLSKTEKSCFVLTDDLKFYEYRRKQLLHFIDLQAKSKVLAEIEELLKTYRGLKSRYDTAQVAEQSEQETVEETADRPDLYLGKYIFQNANVKLNYILIHAWDKLIVLQMANDFKITAEYSRVKRYKIVNDPETEQELLRIYLEDETHTQTDFQDKVPKEEKGDWMPALPLPELEAVVDQTKRAQEELNVHQMKTQKEVERMRDRQMFGPNVMRSLKLEEKAPLARCGDIWIRFTPRDKCVIGIPLVNNCGSPNLTTLMNIQPILQMEEQLEHSLEYSHYLYHLEQRFENLEQLDAFLDSDSMRLDDITWSASKEDNMPPESFAMLLIVMKISDLIPLPQTHLFVCYQIDKVLDPIDVEAKPTTIDMQIFIRMLDFQAILQERKANEIKFIMGSLHEDILAIISTSHETPIRITFRAAKDVEVFEDMITDFFAFTVYEDVKSKDSMEPDADTQGAAKEHAWKRLLYNADPSSLYFGALVLQEPNGVWRFYNHSDDKAYIFFKELLEDLLPHEACKIEKIEYPLGSNKQMQVIDFTESLRNELRALVNTLSSQTDAEKEETLIKFIKAQFRTDQVSIQFVDDLETLRASF